VDRFDGGLDNVFDLQDQVTANVVGAIEPRLRKAEIERATRKRTGNLDAYDFLRGLPVAVFERFCAGPQVVIGSSMGGWMALLLAREMARRPADVRKAISEASRPLPIRTIPSIGASLVGSISHQSFSM
jgi:hypothetical protein